jgi:hypothetical protein
MRKEAGGQEKGRRLENRKREWRLEARKRGGGWRLGKEKGG